MLPLVIGIFSLVTTATSYLATRNAVLQTTEQSVIKNLHSSLTRAQGSLELLMGISEDRSARQIVASYSAVSDTIVAFVANANGHIIASTSLQDIGRHWTESWSDIDSLKIDTVIGNHSLDIHSSTDKKFIDGYISICRHIVTETASLRKKDCGFFAHRIDLNYHYEQATTALTNQAIYNSMGVIIIALLIGFILHIRIVKRANKLEKVVTSFAAGERNNRTGYAGHDEISVIAQSVDTMLDRIVEDEKIITEEKNRLKLLFDTVSDPIVVVKDNGKISSFNKAVKEVFGYNGRELLRTELFELMPDLYIADAAGNKHIFKGLVNRSNQEMFAVRKGGKRFPVAFVINDMDVEGQTEQIAVLRDITERKNAELELKHHRDNLQYLVDRATAEIKAIVKTAVSGVISINQDGKVQIFNPAAEKLFGWKAEDIVGQNVVSIIPDIGTSVHNSFIHNYIKTRKGKIVGVGREVDGLRKDGSTFPAQVSVGHSELNDGKHLFVAFIDDITERKAAQEELLKAKEVAEEAAQVKASFLANMSHEIRTPMNAVIGFSEILLQDEKLGKDSKQHVNTILNSGRSLLHIINDILDFSKIEAGQIHLESVGFHLANSVQDILRTLEFKAAEKDLNLSFNVAPGVPKKVVGDPTRLRQVLINLIGNAIKFTVSGSVMIRIVEQEQSGLLQFSVTDTGIGMTPEQVGKVFEAFSQADSSTNRRFGGTGLGTTISKQIVELMGGEIWVESEVKKGSTFFFTAKMEDAGDCNTCLFEEGGNAQFNYRSPRAFHVLLAEDIPANATLATLRLKQQGHTIKWVENGLLAVEEAMTGEYDIVLMDIQMPELDGLEATMQIRNKGSENVKDIPIIALTASMMREDQIQCLNAGMNAVIGKPIDFPDLLANMEAYVPKGKGKMVELKSPQEEILIATLDFSPLFGVVDYEAGLEVWKEPAVYAHALIDFSQERTDKALRILELLGRTPAKYDEARKLTHVLKGLAGNLFISGVAKEAEKVDALLKDENIESAIVGANKLDIALRLAAKAISGLCLPEDNRESQLEPLEFEKEAVSNLLHKINLALDELNPDSVMPLLRELSVFIDKQELSAIQNGINSFDFYAAKEEVSKLIGRLGLTEE